jgi:hypothetical protein
MSQRFFACDFFLLVYRVMVVLLDGFRDAASLLLDRVC